MSEEGLAELEPYVRAKLENLRSLLRGLETVAVAYSGGVDSTLLLAVAHEQLGERCVALTASSRLIPHSELCAARSTAAALGAEQREVELDPCSWELMRANPHDRCYHCKKLVFTELQRAADAWALNRAIVSSGEHIPLIEGSNASDLESYRPGRQAVRELGAQSPLETAGLTKAEIRTISRALGLPTWDKPSSPCLATRFPVGQPITAELLQRVEQAEELLAGARFTQCRVRMHEGGSLARIEVESGDVEPCLSWLRSGGAVQLKALGFIQVALDPLGYACGSMEEHGSEA